jgi:hypothetical protein
MGAAVVISIEEFWLGNASKLPPVPILAEDGFS